jgi:hypothetical protein
VHAGNDTWIEIKPESMVGILPSPRAWHSSSTLTNGQILVFGGRHNASYLNDLHLLTLDMSLCSSLCVGAVQLPLVPPGLECEIKSVE